MEFKPHFTNAEAYMRYVAHSHPYLVMGTPINIEGEVEEYIPGDGFFIVHNERGSFLEPFLVSDFKPGRNHTYYYKGILHEPEDSIEF